MPAFENELLIDGKRGKDIRGLSSEDISRMEHDLDSLGRDLKLIEEFHSKAFLYLVFVVGYFRNLEIFRVNKHFANSYPEMPAEFQKLLEVRNLAEGLPTKTGAK